SCRVNSDWKSNQPGQQNGCEGNQDGQENAAADEIRDRHLVLERIAEITLQHAGKPDEISLDRMLVEPIFPLQKLNLAFVDALPLSLELSHVAFEIIAGWQLHYGEHQNAGEEQRRNHHQNPAEDVGKHGVAAALMTRFRGTRMCPAYSGRSIRRDRTPRRPPQAR